MVDSAILTPVGLIQPWRSNTSGLNKTPDSQRLKQAMHEVALVVGDRKRLRVEIGITKPFAF